MLVRLSLPRAFSSYNIPTLDTFIILNVIRILCIISLLLVFASNVVTLADDIKAVNRFMAAGGEASFTSSNSTGSGIANATTQNIDYDYILFVTLTASVRLNNAAHQSPFFIFI